jgi:RNA polymerase sigma-70 factor (ECF subfamily)
MQTNNSGLSKERPFLWSTDTTVTYRYSCEKETPVTPENDITSLLTEWKAGSENARDQLIAQVYGELHRMAASYLRNERAAQTLQPTALVHEAYMRLVEGRLPDWESRAHFFGVASRVMRQLLVEHARRHQSLKRGQGISPLPLEQAMTFAPEASSDVIALDAALDALSAVDERQSKIVELRFFGGFSVEEVARALGISTATVGREQRFAEAWLHRHMLQRQI